MASYTLTAQTTNVRPGLNPPQAASGRAGSRKRGILMENVLARHLIHSRRAGTQGALGSLADGKGLTAGPLVPTSYLLFNFLGI